VHLCIEAGISAKGSEAMSRAVAGGHLEVVRLLVDEGASVDKCESQGHQDISVLDLVAHAWSDPWSTEPKNSEHLRIARFLVDRGAVVSTSAGGGQGVLLVASSGGDLELVRLLVDRGVDIKAASDALGVAASRGHVDMVHFLLDSGVRAESGDARALQCAAAAGHLEIVRVLARHGFPAPDALENAAAVGHFEVVRWLLNFDAGPEVLSKAELRAGQCGRSDVRRLIQTKMKKDVVVGDNR